MKKKQTANLIMVAIIAVIVLAGVLCVGMIQGWFDEDDGSRAVLTNIRGIINMERDGVILTLREDTVLRKGDRLTNYPGARADVRVGDTRITFGDQAELEITQPDVDSFCANALAGEFFINAEQSIQLVADNKSLAFSQSVSYLSVRAGAQSVSVLEGSVDGAQAGQVINWTNEDRSVSELNIQSLNAFLMEQIRKANADKVLCFSNGELDNLEAQRFAEKQALLNAAQATEPTQGEELVTAEHEATEMPTSEVTEPEETEPPTTQATEPKVTEPPTTEVTEPEQTEPSTTETTEPEQTQPPTTQSTEPEETQPPATQATEPKGTEPPTTQATQPANTCTITIVCDTILDNWDLLDPAKAGFVPSDGVILSAVTVEFEEGETVFHVLKRVCEVYEIQLEYSWTPLYDSYYIEGINNLYEFDCGVESGWMYKVNGWFPNYGCSSYAIQNGDAIVWCYTCIGLGADVGGGSW